MRSTASTLFVAAFLATTFTGTSAHPPLVECLQFTDTIDPGNPSDYPGVGCVISQTPSRPMRTLVNAALDSPNILASMGSVDLLFSDGSSQTVLSVGTGSENPQCSIWEGALFVVGCQDNPLVDDIYFELATIDSTLLQCLTLADTGVDINRDGHNETFQPDSSFMITPGACPEPGELDI